MLTQEETDSVLAFHEAREIRKAAIPRKKTRAELIKALRELQRIIGQIDGAYGNDRASDRADKLQTLLPRAFNIAVDALSTDPPERTVWKPKTPPSV